jgi:hypothetical protein
MGPNRIFFLFLLVAAGCATGPKATLPRTGQSFPEDGLVIQRAILTARGRQFTLNGYLALSRTGGKRLIITENFGNVLADVLIKPDGAVHVMRSSQAFRPAWIKRYVAADLQCVFGDVPGAKCPGRMLSPKHFIIERFWYKLDLQILEVKTGAQPPSMFAESVAADR